MGGDTLLNPASLPKSCAKVLLFGFHVPPSLYHVFLCCEFQLFAVDSNAAT
jgi:hypothetical protein